MPTLRERNSAQSYAAVTPDNTTAFPGGPCRGLYVGGAGNLVAVGLDDVAVTFTAVAAGTVLPITAKRVNSTSTTATAIVALY
jgi:hypothetical protein